MTNRARKESRMYQLLCRYTHIVSNISINNITHGNCLFGSYQGQYEVLIVELGVSFHKVLNQMSEFSVKVQEIRVTKSTLPKEVAVDRRKCCARTWSENPVWLHKGNMALGLLYLAAWSRTNSKS